MWEDGVNSNWAETDEARWNDLLVSVETFAVKHVLLLFRAIIKYDLRTVAGRRAIKQARLRLATATEDDLREMAEFEAELFGSKANDYIDVSVNLVRLREAREAAKDLLRKEVSHGDGRKGL